jgi:glycosyltransferase involved in cell wall biosynthesis
VINAIDSVLNQVYRDYEIIVVDDGSSDSTRERLRYYGDRVRYFYQENSGVSSARNSGIRVAHGDWIAFLDSDDEWESEYLHTQMHQVHGFPSAVAHTTNVSKVQIGGSKNSHFAECGFLDHFARTPVIIIERPLRVILSHHLCWLQSSIIRRDILLETGLFDARLSILEDLDLLSRVALRGPFTFCRKELVQLFRRQETLKNLTDLGLNDGVHYHEALGRIYDNLSASDLTPEERNVISRISSSNYRALGNLLLLAGLGTEARKYYRKALERYPCVQSRIRVLLSMLPDLLARASIMCRPLATYNDEGISRGR